MIEGPMTAAFVATAAALLKPKACAHEFLCLMFKDELQGLSSRSSGKSLLPFAQPGPRHVARVLACNWIVTRVCSGISGRHSPLVRSGCCFDRNDQDKSALAHTLQHLHVTPARDLHRPHLTRAPHRSWTCTASTTKSCARRRSRGNAPTPNARTVFVF